VTRNIGDRPDCFAEKLTVCALEKKWRVKSFSVKLDSVLVGIKKKTKNYLRIETKVKCRSLWKKNHITIKLFHKFLGVFARLALTISNYYYLIICYFLSKSSQKSKIKKEKVCYLKITSLVSKKGRFWNLKKLSSSFYYVAFIYIIQPKKRVWACSNMFEQDFRHDQPRKAKKKPPSHNSFLI